MSRQLPIVRFNLKMNRLLDANVIYDAGTKAIKSSSFKRNTILYEMNHLLETAKAQEEMRTGKFKPDPTTDFTISERGKTRKISSNTPRDKAINHALCDEILTPSIERLVIYDNSASQKGKGVDFHRRRLVRHLRQYYSTHGSNEGYILLGDFAGYYANIPHDKCLEDMKAAMAKNKDLSEEERELAGEMLARIIEGFSINQGGKKKGVNIGNQCSQDIGVFYPHRVDNCVKIKRGTKGYARYTDDFYAISDSCEELKRLLGDIRKEADAHGITINERKTRICKLSDKWRHLQIQYSLTSTGRIIQKINPKAVTRERRKLRAYKRQLDKDVMPQEDIDECFRSWLGGNYKRMSRLQFESILKLYYKLFERRLTWKKKHGRLHWLTEQVWKDLNLTETTSSPKQKSMRASSKVTAQL